MAAKHGTNPYLPEIGLVLATMLVAFAGFWTIYFGP